MSKIFTIAIREYWAMVATKAFLISIIMMPILMFGGIFAMKWLTNVGGVKERKILVYDGTGQLFSKLKVRAVAQNNFAAALSEAKKEEKDSDKPKGFEENEKFLLEKLDVAELTDKKREEISQQIKDGEYYAFVEMPADIITRAPDFSSAESVEDLQKAIPAVLFRSQNSALAASRQWFQVMISELIKEIRLKEAGIDIQKVNKASTPVNVKGLGLFELDEDGQPKSKEEDGNVLTAIFMPFGVMMLMFMVIFLAAQPALESVLEEKSQKIAEVLLGSANPFQLMIGKLIGVVGGSLTVFSVYITGIIYFASSQNYDIPYEILPWFIVFQILGVFFFAAMFMAVGASVNQLKEAQSMLLPIWMLMMSPMMVWFIIIRDPNGLIATGMSFFPPATPTTLMLRMATGQTVPFWQPAVGLVLMIIATLLVVHVASRIFRVGILWQGKTPTMGEIVKWAFSNR